MMRRGELAQYPPAEVLRAASSERLTGGIEFDGDGAAVCVYLQEGEVYLAARADAEVVLTVDDDLDDVGYEAARQSDERRLRAATVGLVEGLLDRRDGWYFFHALTDHPAQGLWGWPVDELLEEASPAVEAVASGSDPDRPHRPVDGRPPATVPTEEAAAPIGPAVAGSKEAGPEEVETVHPPVPADTAPGWRLTPTPPTEVLDATTWAVLVAMAGSTSETEIVARLGWSTEQAHAAVGQVTRSGILVASGDGVPNEIIGGRIRRLRR